MKGIILLFLIVLISGCTQQTPATKYVCENGNIVETIDQCPKEAKLNIEINCHAPINAFGNGYDAFPKKVYGSLQISAQDLSASNVSIKYALGSRTTNEIKLQKDENFDQINLAEPKTIEFEYDVNSFDDVAIPLGTGPINGRVGMPLAVLAKCDNCKIGIFWKDNKQAAKYEKNESVAQAFCEG